MDVYCQGCGEPWDTYHLRHDAIADAVFEGGLWPSVRKQCDKGVSFSDAISSKWKGKLTPDIRKGFANVGYVFGVSVCDVKQCPCCPEKPKLPAKDAEAIATIATLSGDDIDGAAADMESLR
jgi:hypothetical protein